MAAVFPLDTTKPWVINDVTYEYDTTEDRWFVVSTTATDSVVQNIIENKSAIEAILSDVEAKVFYGDDPPTADDGKYLLWFDTKRTELCVKHEEMWMPASIGGAGNGDNGVIPTLEQVLQAGPFADIPIVLTDKEEAFIDIDPRENRILIAGTDDDDGLSGKPPRISLIHISPASDGQGRADIELDEGGKRLDFEMFSGVDNIHFRFEEDEKFILNKEGDAEFIGRVKAAPAIEPDELATLGQLLTVEQEIEEIQRSTDRGTWVFDNTDFIKEDSTFSLIEKIVTTAEQPDVIITTDDWSECTKLVVSYFSSNLINIGAAPANVHSFKEVEIGMFIDIYNISNGGYGTYRVTAKNPGTNIDPTVDGFSALSMVFDVDFISGRSIAAGPATFKFYEQIPVVEQGDVDALLALDDFTVTYENFGYINTKRADFDFEGSGSFSLEMGDGDKDNYWYAQWIAEDKNGNTINWINEAEPGQKLNKGDHLRIYQPSTGGVVIFKADEYSTVWSPTYVMPRPNSNEWLVNRGRFVFGEPVVIQVGVYTKPAIQGGSTLSDQMTDWPVLPKFWKWKYTEGANTVPSQGFSIDRDITINSSAPLLISLKGRDDQVISSPSSTRTFGEGSTVICYSVVNGQHRIMWSAVLSYITMRQGQEWMECYISKRSNQYYMTNNNMYMLKLSALGN